MFKNELKVKEVIVITKNNGMDLILIKLDDQMAFPALKDYTYLEIKTQKGKGIEWCRERIGIRPKLVKQEIGTIYEMDDFEELTITFSRK